MVDLNLKNPFAFHVATDEKLMELIGMKLHANKFLPLRQAFRAFDPMGRGTITKEALYRILCNALAGITQRQYTALLKRSAIPTSMYAHN